MSVKSALVFAGGDLHLDGPQAHLLEGEWEEVICADSGADHALNAGCRPTLLVGDMDSICKEAERALEGILRYEFPTDKDRTDTHLALDAALERGARRIVIAAGIGNRIDHSLANLLLLAYLDQKGAEGIVTDGVQAVYLLKAGRPLELAAPEGFALSVLPIADMCRGLKERGLRWRLDDFTLKIGDTRTISNEFTNRPARLRLADGAALVVTGPGV